jgi:hypothetical protein
MKLLFIFFKLEITYCTLVVSGSAIINSFASIYSYLYIEG